MKESEKFKTFKWLITNINFLGERYNSEICSKDENNMQLVSSFWYKWLINSGSISVGKKSLKFQPVGEKIFLQI